MRILETRIGIPDDEEKLTASLLTVGDEIYTILIFGCGMNIDAALRAVVGQALERIEQGLPVHELPPEKREWARRRIREMQVNLEMLNAGLQSVAALPGQMFHK